MMSLSRKTVQFKDVALLGIHQKLIHNVMERETFSPKISIKHPTWGEISGCWGPTGKFHILPSCMCTRYYEAGKHKRSRFELRISPEIFQILCDLNTPIKDPDGAGYIPFKELLKEHDVHYYRNAISPYLYTPFGKTTKDVLRYYLLMIYVAEEVNFMYADFMLLVNHIGAKNKINRSHCLLPYGVCQWESSRHHAIGYCTHDPRIGYSKVFRITSRVDHDSALDAAIAYRESLLNNHLLKDHLRVVYEKWSTWSDLFQFSFAHQGESLPRIQFQAPTREEYLILQRDLEKRLTK
jgi:hypothetical protein